MEWEGEATAEPKRQRVANGEWRLVKRQRVANGEWRIVNGFDHPPEVGGYEFKAG